jgi:hypothetical protein
MVVVTKPFKTVQDYCDYLVATYGGGAILSMREQRLGDWCYRPTIYQEGEVVVLSVCVDPREDNYEQVIQWAR